MDLIDYFSNCEIIYTEYSEGDLDDPTKYDPNGNRLYEHPEGSIYRGLTLQEQKALACIRRGKKKTPKSISKRWKKADSNFYARLLQHCVQALLYGSEDVNMRLDRIRVVLRLPYNYRSYCNKAFPRPVPIGYEDYWVYVQFRVDFLVNYLHKIGECAFTARELRKQLWAIRRDVDELLWYEDHTIPLSYKEKVEEMIPQAEEERKQRRGNKGRGENHLVRRRKKDIESIDNSTEM